MLRSFSHLFAGPAEKEGKQTEWPADEASTAPGSSDGASDGADTSLPSDDASDGSVEESSPIHSFEWEGAPGSAADPGIENECVEDRNSYVVDPQPPACAHAPQDDSEAPGIDPAPWPAAEDPLAADESATEEPIKRAPPSRLPHARRDRAARQKYERTADGTYSKTRAVCDWDYDSDGELKQFAAEEALLQHERWCHDRRLRGEHPAKYETLSEESQALARAMNACAEEQHEATRAEIQASTGAVLRELKTLSLGDAQGAADGADRLTVFELVHGNLRCDELRALLAAKGILCRSRNKAALAKTAAVSLAVAEVRAFLADEGGARTSGAAAARKRPDNGAIQTTLPVVKRPRVQAPPHADGTADCMGSDAGSAPMLRRPCTDHAPTLHC